jgi:hypothetical protein
MFLEILSHKKRISPHCGISTVTISLVKQLEGKELKNDKRVEMIHFLLVS